jgi:adenosylmethionine---8-amino-7-oxononanoate aminotransferase
MDLWQEKDFNTIWHPCSQMKDYEEHPSIVISRGKDAYLYDLNGKAYLDAVSSWWVNLFGHSNKRLNRAVHKQLNRLEHVIFAGFSHQPAILLAEKLLKLVPAGLNKVFFADNGSSAVEAALKMSFQYHQQTGSPSKTRFAALDSAYHGETLGALAVGGLGLYSRIYQSMMMETYRTQGPDCYRCPYQKKRENCNAECFENIEKLAAENHKNICGIIIEPMVQCAAGMKIYPPVYLKKLRALCDRFQIHLIADEIATGFGRTGKMFACEHAGISPDIMCLSKGLTAGYLPLSLTLTTDRIYQAFYADYSESKAFLHSHSYTGNPLACSAALGSLKIFEEDKILEKNMKKSELFKEYAGKYFKDHPLVGEYRQIGMIGAIELVKNKTTKEEFDWKQRTGYHIYQIALKKGVILRPLGNIIYFMPPYIVEEKEIRQMFKTAYDSINEYFGIEKNN